jgi:hypothetical protein
MSKLTKDELMKRARKVADMLASADGLADLARAWCVEVEPDSPLGIVCDSSGGRIYDSATGRTYALVSNGGQSVMAEAVKAYNAAQVQRSEDYLAVQREFKATLKACEAATDSFQAAHFARKLPTLAVKLMEAAKR